MRPILFFPMLVLSTSIFCATTTPGFFFFGDSLTDSGYQNNNPLVKSLGKTPQWTSPNGHTWAYYFLQNYAHQTAHYDTTLIPNNVDAATFFNPVPTDIQPILDGNNFAAGGSTTGGTGLVDTAQYKAPSLLNQIDYFVNRHAPKHSITLSQHGYLIWSGTNDLMKELGKQSETEVLLHKLYLSKPAALLHLFNFQKISERFITTQTQIAENLLTAVTKLQKAGARKIAVLLLPDVGDTPLMNIWAQNLQSYGSTITAAQLSAEMHTVINNTNALIQTKLAGLNVLVIDGNHVLQPIIYMKTPGNFQETQQQFGKQQDFLIVNNKESACSPKQQALTCIPTVPNAEHYVFEDVVHPTNQTHHMIGDFVYYKSKSFFE